MRLSVLLDPVLPAPPAVVLPVLGVALVLGLSGRRLGTHAAPTAALLGGGLGGHAVAAGLATHQPALLQPSVRVGVTALITVGVSWLVALWPRLGLAVVGLAVGPVAVHALHGPDWLALVPAAVLPWVFDVVPASSTAFVGAAAGVWALGLAHAGPAPLVVAWAAALAVQWFTPGSEAVPSADPAEAGAGIPGPG